MTTLRTAAILAAALLVAGEVRAQTARTETTATKSEPTTSTTATKAPDESPLVKAARESAAKRTKAKKSRLSIDDKDVKKSAGKLIETTSKPLAPIPAAEDVETRMRAVSEPAAAARDKAKETADRVAAAQKEVESLELELRRIEETYYDEDDPDFREDVIEKRFEETKSRLGKARQDLENARNAASGSGVSTP
ncbi:MAG: hypothetical protein NDJ92_00955 [Thermoanaerobaculia bacterium]|nr:hypothetical protein [Thermoanaerobaculia bacterium]